MKILHSEVTGTQTSFSTNFGGKLSFILSFLFPERIRCCYIYFHRSCTTTIISLEPCALNAEFRHFISYWDLMKISLLCRYHWKRDRGSKPAQRQGEGRVTLEITLLALVGPCPHKDRDYCTGSNFWKFCLIRTGFTLGKLVFRWKCLDCLDWNRLFWCSEYRHSR
jgi:hypothetical protein